MYKFTSLNEIVEKKNILSKSCSLLQLFDNKPLCCLTASAFYLNPWQVVSIGNASRLKQNRTTEGYYTDLRLTLKNISSGLS